MVIAALVSFAILLAAWMAAPDRPRRDEMLDAEAPAPESHPLAA